MESNNTGLLTVKYHTPMRLCCRHTHTACLYAVCVWLQQRLIGETSLVWLISYTFPTSVIAYSSSSYIVSFVLMNLSEYCHLKECDTVAVLVVLLIYCNACDATQCPCDVTRYECVLWRQVTRYEYSLEKMVYQELSTQWFLYSPYQWFIFGRMWQSFWICFQVVCEISSIDW